LGRPELYYVGKRGGAKDSVNQHEINELLVRLAREGKRVVRLKGGDPFVFGRGSEEAQAMYDASIPFEIVPGITAGIAAPAYAGIPVTHRGLSTSVTFVTGHEDPAKPHTQTSWAALAKTGGTLVLYMGVKTLSSITRALLDGGMPAEIPAAAIQWGTRPQQRTIAATLKPSPTKSTRKTSGAGHHRHRLVSRSARRADWLEKRPLRQTHRRHPCYATGAGSDRAIAGARCRCCRDAGDTDRPSGSDPLRSAIAELSHDWLIFTSQNAVSIFWEQPWRGQDARAPPGLDRCRRAGDHRLSPGTRDRRRRNPAALRRGSGARDAACA
jgi:uroporphyrinogen III methyltransferase/synthase